MRYSLVILLFSLTLSSSGSTYYVATNGNDGIPVQLQHHGTWKYGFNRLVPGDILYIRGGTYTPLVITSSSSRHCGVIV